METTSRNWLHNFNFYTADSHAHGSQSFSSKPKPLRLIYSLSTVQFYLSQLHYSPSVKQSFMPIQKEKVKLRKRESGLSFSFCASFMGKSEAIFSLSDSI